MEVSGRHVLQTGPRSEHRPESRESRKSRRQTTITVLAFVATVFVLDLLTPLGMPYWLLHSVPFFFIRYKTPRNFSYLLAMACTILILAGYVLSPGARAEPLTHRASAAIILWVVVIALARRRS
jgi:hypothetical protein